MYPRTAAGREAGVTAQRGNSLSAVTPAFELRTKEEWASRQPRNSGYRPMTRIAVALLPPVNGHSSTLPDYYGDERRARRRVRVRHVVGWIGLAACVVGVVEVVRLIHSGR
jgi:hypothetical protein